MEIWIALISGLCVAIPNVIATLSTNKQKKFDKVEENIKKDLGNVKTEINSNILKVKTSLKEEKLSRCKVDLINAMSRIQNGYSPTEEERRILIEEKEQYNGLGGNSYVDDMFERLKKEGKL